ncbi:hypothetical protein C922_05407 [Plasmodium inui San Antonio 1]|uniref:Uncharacterized protein n=1 Tax=Plasmodium inui San Antonio 1 TaxID=1237626 RepID=W7A528_9APIC|nr:hypothetical protein C922_05407 [Plasmodium inui San Antonio 1]EUD64209.1 hypothetical protein C922_05407 [Plasmodium inui San Antonio 1]
MQSFLHMYIGSLLKKGLEQKECKKGQEATAGICRLRTNNQEKIGTGTTTLEEIFPNESTGTLANVSRMSRSICIGLESWISTLDGGTGTAAKIDFRGACSYDEFMAGGTPRGNSNKCIFEREKLAWIDHKDKVALSMGQEYQQTLKMCMELVTLIMITAGLDSTSKRRTYYENTREGVCGRIYKGLHDWAGEEVAAKIMRDWFSHSENLTGEKKEFQLPARDVYEIITETILGISKGDKEITCDRVFPATPGEKGEESAYKGGSSGDTTIVTSIETAQDSSQFIDTLDQVLAEVKAKVEVSDQKKYLALTRTRQAVLIKNVLRKRRENKKLLIHFF